jgi:hypothetical protein
MIISFDIDNTLIPYSDEFTVEDQSFKAKLLGAEPIRKRTIQLFKELEDRGHQVWIYTTSFRTKLQLKRTFWSYGLSPTNFINESINQKKLKQNHCKASKNPKLFGIDWHIDDSEGVGKEGEQYGFRTMIISPDDLDWTKNILERI